MERFNKAVQTSKEDEKQKKKKKKPICYVTFVTQEIFVCAH